MDRGYVLPAAPAIPHVLAECCNKSTTTTFGNIKPGCSSKISRGVRHANLIEWMRCVAKLSTENGGAEMLFDGFEEQGLGHRQIVFPPQAQILRHGLLQLVSEDADGYYESHRRVALHDVAPVVVARLDQHLIVRSPAHCYKNPLSMSLDKLF